jgi:hypothetical protein
MVQRRPRQLSLANHGKNRPFGLDDDDRGAGQETRGDGRIHPERGVLDGLRRTAISTALPPLGAADLQVPGDLPGVPPFVSSLDGLVVRIRHRDPSADVEFGPGLNVFYGPNDLSKSTLATALRAALLVPTSSSEAERFSPWQADVAARVSLTLVDDGGQHWRVSKTYGHGAESRAELLHSKDAVSFALDCKGRQVEERIRGLLAWGIPAPGGKGARSLPDSFLANVLLAPQAKV